MTIYSPTGGIWGQVAQFVGQWAWIAPVVGVLLTVGLMMGFGARYIARGGGQYGIIEGYCGMIGAGKTTLAVQHCLGLARARSAVLLSNIPVICCPTCTHIGMPSVFESDIEELVQPRWWHRRRRGVRQPKCEVEHRLLPMGDDGLDLADLTRQAFALRDQRRGLVLFMDEVGVVMPARLWKDFSVALMWVLQQSRKLSCEWVWTAQDPSFVDSQLRSLTAVVHFVNAMPPPSVWRRVKGKRPWLMSVSSYTPGNAPRANGEQAKKDKRIARKFVRYRQAWEAAFDTDGVVMPSKHLRGAELLVAAVEASGDAHVVRGTSNWGPVVQVEDRPGEGEAEPVGA